MILRFSLEDDFVAFRSAAYVTSWLQVVSQYSLF